MDFRIIVIQDRSPHLYRIDIYHRVFLIYDLSQYKAATVVFTPLCQQEKTQTIPH